MAVLTAVYAAVLGAVAVGFALLAGASGVADDPGLIGRDLIFSAVTGVGAVALACRAAGRPVRSWLLTIGVVPAAVELVWLAATR
ncbi:MAG: hypothetical protein JWQ45_2158 [Blastococcus sp.]|nr:hypothetical protein [Blastococcus sp.]